MFDQQAQIDSIQDQKITVIDNKGERRSKVVRLFLGGDYEYLLENFDQNSAASNDFCLWCPATKQNRQNDPFEMPSHWGEGELVNTLESLKERSRTKSDPVFRFQLDRVVILPLHLTLGLTAHYLAQLKIEVRTFYPFMSTLLICSSNNNNN
jgi:hypothetical protein